MASLRVAAFAAALIVIFEAEESHGRERTASDPACQIVFQEAGKPPVRMSMPISSPGNPGKAITYRDPETKVLFYVESDGRHLAAIDSNGKLLWVRNPFEDRGLCPYRNARPVIRSVRPYDIPPDSAEKIAEYMKRRGADPSHRCIWIEFDSSQFGEVDQTTGDFLYEGQN